MKQRCLAALLAIMILFAVHAPKIVDVFATDTAPEVAETEEKVISEESEPQDGASRFSTEEMTQETTATPASAAESTPEPGATPELSPTAASEPAGTPETTAVPASTAESTPEPSATPELSPTETSEPAGTPETTVAPVPVSADLSAISRYGYAYSEPVCVSLQLSGGVAPYTVCVQDYEGDALMEENQYSMEAEGSYTYSYLPTLYGNCTVKVTVTDAIGQTDADSVSVPVAAPDSENGREYLRRAVAVQRTGNWSADLVAIAVSQIGYRESTIDFCIDEDGEIQGYTIYGDWYGADYREWCAMFVSWSLNQANVPSSAFPYEARCQKMMQTLVEIGVYEDEADSYVPESGDVVFFNWDSECDPDHVAIVERVDETNIYTIEGNSGKQVQRDKYARSDRRIMGYANMEKVMLRAGVLSTATPEPTETATPEPTETATPEPTETATPEPTETATPEPTETATPEPTETATPEPTETATPEPTETATPEPTETATPDPTETATPDPTETATPDPTETATPDPTETATPDPTETATPDPTETATPDPTETATPDPTETVTSEPTETATSDPTETATPEPTETATPDPTETATPEPTETATPDPTETATPEPTETATPEPTEMATPEPIYYCNLEEHIHTEGCFRADGNLICTLPAHIHREECTLLPTPAATATPEATATAEPEYYCGIAEHIHGEACYDENGARICTLAEHAHDESCRTAPDRHAYEALDGGVMVSAECAGAFYAERISTENSRYIAYAEALSQALAEDRKGELLSLEIYDIAFAAADGTHPTVALTFRLDAADLGEEYTLLVAHLALDGWEWLPCTVEKSDSTILLQFETASFSPFAILAVEEQTAFEGFLEEIHALTLPAGDADEAAVAAYEAAVAQLRAQLAAARESGVLTDEEYAALLALLPAEETAYEALLAKVETLESRDSLDDAMLADGEALLQSIRLAWEKGELAQEEYEQLVHRVCVLLYCGAAEYADGSNWLRLKNSNWFQEYRGSVYTELPDCAAKPLPMAAAVSERMARTASVMSLANGANAVPPSDVQVSERGGANLSEDGTVSVSKTIQGTDLENVFDITLQVQTSQKIEEVSQEPDMAVVIVMDISNTMLDNFGNTTRYEAAMLAAEEFLDQFAGRNSLGISKVGYVAFNTNAHQIFALQACGTQEQANALKNTMRVQTGNIIDNYERDSKGTVIDHRRFTNIEAGLAMAGDMLEKVSNKNKFIIFLSDGFPTTYISSGYNGYDPYDSKGTIFYDKVLSAPCQIGTSYSNEAAIRARTKAEQIKDLGTTIFSIGVDVGGQTIQKYITQSEGFVNGGWKCSTVDRRGTTYEIGSATSAEAYKNWLRSSIGSDYYYDSTDSAGLSSAYSQIFETIKHQVEAGSVADWVANDPLPNVSGSVEYVEFIGFYDKTPALTSGDLTGEHEIDAENTASFDSTKSVISWDLKNSGYQAATSGSTTVYTYSLVYRVRLKNENGSFVEGEIYPTNDPTTLQYRIVQGTDGNYTISDAKELDFSIPSVQGYLAELKFQKIDSLGNPVQGAVFTLCHDTVNCAFCRGDGESRVSVGPFTATSDANGAVSFGNIPSGHKYVLAETVVPAEYEPCSDTFRVCVDYDAITVTVTAVDGTLKEWTGSIVNPVRYELPQTGGSGTVWYIAGGTALLALALLMYKAKRQRGCN